jgi:hypothetical protein
VRIAWRYAAVAATLGVGSFLLAGCGGEDKPASPTATVDLQGLTLQRAYDLLDEAMRRPGFVLHSTLRASEPNADGGEAPYYTKQFWIDGEREALREEFLLDPSRKAYEVAEEGTYIVVGSYVYVPDDPDEALRFDAEDFCPGTTNAVVSQFLECGRGVAGIGSPDFRRAPASDIDTHAEYKGRQAVALVLDTGEHPPSNENPAKVHVYLDRQSFLPLARVVEWRYDGGGKPFATYVSEYEHEFVSADTLSSDLLDPRSIGYGAENEDVLLDQIAAEVPIYWLGDEYQPPGDLDPLVLTRIYTTTDVSQWPQDAPLGGLGGWLIYDTPNGLSGINLLLWRRDEWESFMQTQAGRFLSDASCAQRAEVDLDVGRAVIYTLPPLRYPLSVEDLGPCAGRVAMVPLTDPPVIVFVDLGDVIVDARPEVTGHYDSVEAMRAVLGGLRRR